MKKAVKVILLAAAGAGTCVAAKKFASCTKNKHKEDEDTEGDHSPSMPKVKTKGSLGESSGKLFEPFINRDGDAVYCKTQFGRYYTENWTKMKPLVWKILSIRDGKALLMCDKAVDMMEFDRSGKADWDKSSIRKWLNKDFLDTAFSDEEKYAIDYENESTGDAVFLLSSDEYIDFVYKKDFELGAVELTETAKDHARVGKIPYDEFSCWLRSCSDAYVMIVDGDGIFDNIVCKADKPNAVVPCIWVELDRAGLEFML